MFMLSGVIVLLGIISLSKLPVDLMPEFTQPTISINTTYSFGLDDQEFVVAFDTDDAGAFLDLVQRLRTTEASAYTLRDTPSFTCIATSVERALSAVDGEPVPATALGSLSP